MPLNQMKNAFIYNHKTVIDIWIGVNKRVEIVLVINFKTKLLEILNPTKRFCSQNIGITGPSQD